MAIKPTLKLTPIILKEINRYLTTPKKVRKFGFDDTPVKTGKDIERPQEALDREMFKDAEERFNKADGGRIGFADGNISKSEASFKFYEDKFGKKLLNKMAQSQYGKNFRELDKNNELKFFKNQVNKYEDFIKENKRYPNKSEAYSIGLKQSGKRASPFTDKVKTKIKKIYSSGEGGSTYISKKLAEEGINIDDSTIRRFITAEEQAGNIVRPKQFKTQQADPSLPKDRYNKIREVTKRDLKGFRVGRSGTEVLAPKGSKYKITFKAAKTPETSRVPLEYQGTQYYKSKAQADNALKGYKKFSKDFKKAGEAGRSLRDIILRDISDPNVESAILRLKEGEDLATAHRLSYKQVKKLGQLYNISNLGVEDPAINSGAIRRFENKLERLYEEQRNLIKTAKRSTNKNLPVPKNLQDKIDLNNRKISAVVDLTNQRIQGVLIDTKTLKPSTYGINYIKTYGMGLLENKNVKDITNADLNLIELNLQNQINRENRLGAKTESFLRDRQQLLKYVDDLAKPGFLSKIPAKLKPLALGTGLTIGGISAAAAADDNSQSTGFTTGEKAAGAAAAGSLAIKPVRKAALKTAAAALGPLPVAATYPAFGFDIKNPIDRLILGAELAGAPSLVKASLSATDKIKNPLLRKAAQSITVGSPKLALRLASRLSPIGAGLLGLEGLYQAGKFTKKRIGELQAMSPEQRRALRARQAAFAFEGAREGGIIGKKSGTPPVSGPTPHGLPYETKGVKKL